MEKYLEIKNLKVDYVTHGNSRNSSHGSVRDSSHGSIRDSSHGSVLDSTHANSKNVLDIEYLGINKGSSFGLVGESGAGKTVLSLAIQRLLATPPGKIVSGEILFCGEDLLKKSTKEMGRVRGKKIAMVFQDPLSALNPVFTAGFQMRKIVQERQHVSKKEARQIVIEMIGKVKLPDAENIFGKYPHELSGGQRQRVIIAMALLCGAEFIIADEPTRNLDVTIQAGILRLIHELQQQFNVTILFIANNLSLVSSMCDEMAVIKNGRIIESGNPYELLRNPKDSYTNLLTDSITPKHPKNSEPDNDEEKKLEVEDIILEVKALKKYFSVKNTYVQKNRLYVKAVDGVDFSLRKGEILGIVGESGC